MNELKIDKIEEIIKYNFNDKMLLTEAFTHSSYANLFNTKYHYERLEFLGDSVLGLVIGEYVFKKFEDSSEGTLTHLKSHMVNSDSLSKITEILGLNEFLLVPVNEKNIREKKKIKENLYEAVIGAIYLDSNLEYAKKFILTSMEKASILINDKNKVMFDPKSTLQEILQKEGIPLPEYKIISRKGPVHNLTFQAEIEICNKSMGTGFGKSKKEAHQNCAKKVLEFIDNNRNWIDEFRK